MRLNDSVRVGVAVVLGAIVLVWATFFLRGSAVLGGTYLRSVWFAEALGVQSGAYVRARGVDVGTVESVKLARIGPDRRVRAVLRLRFRKSDYDFQPGDSVRIVGGTLGFSQPYVDITPDGRKQPLQDLAEPWPGEAGPNLDRLLSTSEQLLANLNQLTLNMNRLAGNMAQLTGDQQVIRDLKRTAGNFARVSDSGLTIARNMQAATERADRLIGGFQTATNRLDRTMVAGERLLSGLRGTAEQSQALMRDSRSLVSDTRKVVEGTGDLVQNTNQTVREAGGLVTDTRTLLRDNKERFQTVIERLDSSLKQFEGTLTDARAALTDPKLRGDLGATVSHLREATENLRKITADVQGMTGDPKVQQDLRATVTGLREATSKASAVLDQAGNVLGTGGRAAKTVGERISEARLSGQLLRSVRSDRTRLDFDATIPWSENTLFRVGFFDFGENTRFNAQAGQRLGGRVWARYGLRASRVGAGLDLGSRDWAPVSVDLFGLDRPRLDLRGNLRLGPGIDLTVGLDNLLYRADPIVGLRARR